MNIFTVVSANILVTNLDIYRYVVRNDSTVNNTDTEHILKTVD